MASSHQQCITQVRKFPKASQLLLMSWQLNEPTQVGLFGGGGGGSQWQGQGSFYSRETPPSQMQNVHYLVFCKVNASQADQAAVTQASYFFSIHVHNGILLNHEKNEIRASAAT